MDEDTFREVLREGEDAGAWEASQFEDKEDFLEKSAEMDDTIKKQLVENAKSNRAPFEPL